MSLKSFLGSAGGDIWKSWGCLALWPWPAVVMGYPKTQFTFRDYREFTKLLKPGDFLLTASEPYFLSNRAIAGTAFKHLAVYSGSVSGIYDHETHFVESPNSFGVDYKHTGHGALHSIFERTVTHAISEGVVCQDLGDMLFHSDYVIAVRPWLDRDQQEIIVRQALTQVGKKYDFSFKNTPEDLYCTELGLLCCQKAAITPPSPVQINTSFAGFFLPMDRFKSPVLLADSFLQFEPVCASLSCYRRSAGLISKSRWPDLVRLSLQKAKNAGG
jgi:hypothetical protein